VQSPTAVFADFNEDGKDDAILIVNTKGLVRGVRLISSPEGFRITEELTAYKAKPGGLDFYIGLVKKGTVFSGLDGKKRTLPSPGYHWTFPGKAANTYYYKDGVWLDIQEKKPDEDKR